jgi:hypothetical protein
MRRWALPIGVIGVLVVGGLWLFSHIAPEDFGSCHDVAAYLGQSPTIRDCQPYEATEFAVPLAVVAALVPLLLVAAGDEPEAEIPVPAWLGIKLFYRRRIEAATTDLEEAAPTLDERLQEYLQTLPGGGEGTS